MACIIASELNLQLGNDRNHRSNSLPAPTLSSAASRAKYFPNVIERIISRVKRIATKAAAPLLLKFVDSVLLWNQSWIRASYGLNPVLQLAMNQRGNLRGNYTDETTDKTMQIQGGIDAKTQRVAWTVGSNSTTIMEAGRSNLTESEATALPHKAGKTEPWTLVRLQQPK